MRAHDAAPGAAGERAPGGGLGTTGDVRSIAPGRYCYALGRNRYDAHPETREADSLRAFARDVLCHRARDKASAGYVTAGYGGDGRRCAANALDRNWLALDVDGIDPGVHAEWRMYAAKWQGFGWPTASSTPTAPRERIIITLDAPVSRADGMRIGALLSRDVGDEFGAAVRIDPCTYRAEQPCFLPVIGAEPFYLLGDPLATETWLAQCPPPPPTPPPATADVAAIADARMRWIVGMLGRAGLLRQPLDNGRGYAVECPWSHAHTHPDPLPSTASALLFPAEANGWYGAYRCLHAHCEHRRLRDLVQLLRGVEEVAA